MPVVAQAGDDAATAVARTYREFGQLEARGRSAAYEALAESVAGDSALVSFIASLPPPKRQPNLLFAAARYLLGAPPAIGPLRELASQSRAELTQVIMARRTQTNEPARCAVLLPALAQLPQPLALIEAGASAGLNLLLDRYSYDYAGYRLAGLDPDAPVLRCEPSGPVPLPARVPAISWRAGLDLNPLDVTRADDARWLSCLVWPGEGDRAQRLEAAIGPARRHAGHLPHLGAVVSPRRAAGAVRQHRPRPRRHLAVQRTARCRARYGRTRPGRAHLRPGPRRRRHRPDRKPRDVATMAALTGEPRR